MLLFIGAVSFIFLSVRNGSFQKYALLSEGGNIGAVDSGPSLNRERWGVRKRKSPRDSLLWGQLFSLVILVLHLSMTFFHCQRPTFAHPYLPTRLEWGGHWPTSHRDEGSWSSHQVQHMWGVTFCRNRWASLPTDWALDVTLLSHTTPLRFWGPDLYPTFLSDALPTKDGTCVLGLQNWGHLSLTNYPSPEFPVVLGFWRKNM